MNKVKFIYFDIGNVMVDTNDYFKGVTSKFNIPLSEFIEFWNGEDGADGMTRGKISAQKFWQNAVKKFNIESAGDFNFLESWLNDYKPITETHELAGKLSKQYKIGLISNLYPGMITELVKKSLVPDLDYSAVILSCETGFRKPEKEIYRIATEKAGVSPENILFIDDRIDFIEGAAEYGWQTFRFDGSKIKTLATKLENLLLK